MEGSILAQRERVSLGNGMALRLLSALEVLQARREAGELAGEDRERALCSNACLLARALEQEEVPQEPPEPPEDGGGDGAAEGGEAHGRN